MRASRNALRLLLLLAALAIAGAAREPWAEPLQERIAAAAPAPASPGTFTSNDGPRQPAVFNVARAPGLPVAGRVLENGPPTGTLRPEFRPSTDLPLFASSLAASRLRALERSRLAFAHDGMIARSGALSSFSSGLPPPIHA